MGYVKDGSWAGISGSVCGEVPITELDKKVEVFSASVQPEQWVEDYIKMMNRRKRNSFYGKNIVG